MGTPLETLVILFVSTLVGLLLFAMPIAILLWIDEQIRKKKRRKIYKQREAERLKLLELEKEKLERDKIRRAKPRSDWTVEDWYAETGSIYWYEQVILKKNNYQCSFCGCREKNILHVYYKPSLSDGFLNITIDNVGWISENRFRIFCDNCYFENLSPRNFERFVGKIFEKMGYSVSLTAATGDEGIDLICTRKGTNEKVVVQCKKYQGAVGSPIVRNFYGSLIHSNANKGYIVTTGYFTSSAINWAKGKPIEFIDRDKIIKLLNDSISPNPQDGIR